MIGYLAGPSVYVFDEYSLANPVGSHTTVVRHARPGHEKFIGPAWMLARFGVPGTAPVAGGPSSRDIAAARVALGCNPFAGYLHAVTAPWTVSQAVANVEHAWGFTTFSYSADPVVAATQLCGPTALQPPDGSR